MKALDPATSHPKPSTGTTILPLDGLRGVAILAVVFQHCLYFPPILPFANVGNGFLQAGRLGVAIFFVLSGFLMGLVIFNKERKFQVPSYARRRFARIYPPFAFSLLFASCVATASGAEISAILKSVWMYLSTLANFTGPPVEINSVYWSLLIEIHFYVLLPLTYHLLRMVSGRADTWTCVLFASVPVVMRTLFYMFTPGAGTGWNGFPLVLPLRMDSFAGGLLVATLYLRPEVAARARPYSRHICFYGVLVLAISFLTYGLTFVQPGLMAMNLQVLFLEAAYVTSQIGTCMILWMVLNPGGWWWRFFCNRFLVICGIISYEWYLFHYPLVHLCKKWLPDGTAIGYAGKVMIPSVGGFLLSLLVFFYFSRPLQESIRSGFTIRRK